MKRHILFGLLAIFAIITAGTAVTQIQPGERGVARRFGRIVATPGPGLYLGLPWGMERVDRVPVGRLRRVIVGHNPEQTEGTDLIPDGQLLTGDHNLINVQAEINYTVNEDEVAKYAFQAERADALVARAAETALAEWVAGRNVDDVLLQGKAVLPGWLVREVAERIRPYDFGVSIEEASVTHLYPPAEVKNAFDEVARAQTEIRTRVYQAEQEAGRRRRDAEAEKFRSERMSAAYAQEQHLQARAEAENFEKRLQQYRRLKKENPQYLAGIWWDEMSRLFARMRQNGRLDLLDNHLGADGLDITQMPALPKKK